MPRTAELLDELCCDTLRAQGSNLLPREAGAALILETDGSAEQALDDLETLGVACETAGALDISVAQTPSERERVWAPRRTLSEAIRRRAAYKISEDVAVPRGRLAEAVTAMRSCAESAGVTCATYGHAGDGNLHVNLLFNRAEERPAVEAVADQIFRIAIEFGGTITGEHGIGLAKRHALPWEAGERRLALERAIKHAVDPKGLFNPGKVWSAAAHG
jgi:glycolate oxidase